MQEISDFLGYAGAAAFVLVAVASLWGWNKNRDRAALCLALALAHLAAAAVLGRINQATDYDHQFLTDLGLAAFIGSGYWLVRFRDQFIAIGSRVRAAAAFVAVGLTVAAIAMGIPGGPAAVFTTAELVTVITIVSLWSIAVGEPVVRFWVASRNLPRVQKARLRLLSAGFAGIILVLFVNVGARPGMTATTALVLNLIALAIVPMLYASFAPPSWLRRAWQPEEESISITEDLAEFAPDREALAERILKHALTIVGAAAGYLRDVDGTVIGVTAMTDDDIAAIDALAAGGDGGSLVRLPDGPRYAIVLPIQNDGSEVRLAVVSGSFTPLFGSYEVEKLREFAALSSVALDRVRLLEALAGETDRYQALMQAVSDLGQGFVVTDGTRLVYANDAYCLMTGYTIQELRAMQSLLELVVPHERDAVARWYAARIRDEKSSDHYETSLVAKNGTTVDVEVSLKVLEPEPELRMISIVRDISERKRAQQELAKQSDAVALLQKVAVAANESTLHEALQVAVDGVCEYSGWPLGHVFLPSGTGRELVATGIWHVGTEGDFTEFVRATEETKLKVGEGLPGRVMESGHTQWIADVSSDPKFKRRGLGVRAGFAFPILIGREPVGVVEFYSPEFAEPDNYLLNVVSHIGAQLGRAAERERVDSLRDDFISNAAHELRTPITSIVGFASLMKESERALSEEELRLAVQSIARQGERLRALVNNLLDFTRVQQGRLAVELQRIDARKALLEAADVVPAPDGKTVTVTAPDGLDVVADPVRLEQILTNLLTNAYRYGGTTITLHAAHDDGEITLSIADDGPGVPPTLAATLFDPFTRGDSPSVEGSGLGLAIVKMLAQIQGGDIEYRDRDGGGGEFLVRLPGA